MKIQGKVQEEQLDSWRAAGERGREQAEEGAGRNQHGFSLRDFGARRRGRRNAAPLMDGKLGRILRGLSCG